MEHAEPHVLTRWYAQRRRLWLRMAWTPALVALLLPALLVAQVVLYALYAFTVRGWSSGVQQGGTWVSNLFIAFNREIGPALTIAAELTVAVALGLAGWQLAYALVPPELAFTQSRADLHAYRRTYSRQAIRGWVAAICLPAHAAAFVAAAGLLALGRTWPGSWAFNLADPLLYCGLFALLAAAAVRLALTPVVTQVWFVLLPLGLYMVLRGALQLAWATLSDLELADVLTEAQADGIRLGATLVLAVVFGTGAWLLERRA